MAGLRLIWPIFCITAMMLAIVYLRHTNNQLFYTLQSCHMDQARLRQELWYSQLELESMTSPVAVGHVYASEPNDRVGR